MMTDDSKATVGVGILGCIGGLLLVVALFLPWLTLGSIEANGFTKLGILAYAYLAVGLCGAGAGVATVVKGKPVGTGLLGVLAVLVGLVHVGFISPAMSQELKNISVGAPSLGIGSYLPYGGTVALLLAAFVARMGAGKPSEDT